MMSRRHIDECAFERERPAAVAAVAHVPARHPAPRYGLALNDRGYFRESVEVLGMKQNACPLI
ncbi:hypothetical protein [Bradyrhizobium sp. SSUT77]|uniref:hypothetical protein n=1 Tax=Bradyrhizobium sp. SSUT77 TaxID=3040603 RepID=UPI00244AE0AD|nr:hypothetical protein [Bradyrhizobium sp. SSUT77]MDH2346984.1 hypothetical protein [Bradyrhizobium sp. SSUT77]